MANIVRFQPAGWTPGGVTESIEGSSTGDTSDSGTLSEQSDATPLFHDGFESGDHTHSENGYAWDEVSGEPDSNSVDGAPVVEGDWSSRFRNNADVQQNRLIRFKGPALTEFWFEYYMRIPGTDGAPAGEEGDYSHLNTAGADNNKWVEFFPGTVSDGRDKLNIIPHTWPNDAEDGGSRWQLFLGGSGGGAGHVTPDFDSYIVVPDDRSVWFRHRYWVRLTTTSPTDLQIELKHWLKKGSDSEILIFDETNTNDAVEEEWHKIENWQILGFNNAEYPEDITWYVDEVRLYDQDPGW